MNIFEFINSKDVREHLEKLNYQFTTPEAAYIVYQSKKKTLTQKFAMWEEIIKTMSDCSMDERPYMKAIPSFHEFLKAYIELHKKHLDNFPTNDGTYIYWFSVRPNDNNNYDDIYNRIYTDYALCLEYAHEYCENVSGVEIHKRKVNANECVGTKLVYDSKFNVMNIESEQGYLEDTDIANAFDGMWFNFPTPFVRGDIVFDSTRVVPEPFVLELLRTWDEETLIKYNFRATGPYVREAQAKLEMYKIRGDHTDMWTFGYEYDKGCTLCYKEGRAICYLDLEIYRGELTEEKRLLKPYAAYLRRECGRQLAFNSYMLILKELQLEEQKQAFKELYGNCSKIDLGV